jgi:uncharacterized protein (TIGR02145 family)
LPSGVTASWASNTITISGTPTASGTFNYSIPLTGGCGTVNATGTITVTAPTAPTFTQVGPYLSGASIPALATTSTNGISGTWSPTISNTATTTYTFTPSAGQCGTTTTMTITINQPLQYTLTANDSTVCAGTTVTLSVNIQQANTLTDIDGNNYQTVQIGTQIWMKENLRTTKYSDGTTIPLVTDNSEWTSNYNNSTSLPMMSWYDNDQSTYTDNKFGALYNWYSISTTTNGNRNPCPIGWHLPTNEEWSILADFLGGTSIAGGKLKSIGTTFWLNPNTGATNESGFNGFPSGYRRHWEQQGTTFVNVFGIGGWWSSTVDENDQSYAQSIYLGNYYNDILTGNSNNETGLSVRCIKD